MTRLLLFVLLSTGVPCNAFAQKPDPEAQDNLVKVACQEPTDSKLLPVPAEDPLYDLLVKTVAEKRTLYSNETVDFLFQPFCEIRGRGTESLFPGSRLFVAAFLQRFKIERGEDGTRPRGAGAGSIAISVGEKGSVTVFDRWESFGTFLRESRTKVTNAPRATLVWDAFCEIYRRKRTGRTEQISERVWRVGVTERERGNDRSYLEIHLQPDMTVDSVEYK